MQEAQGIKELLQKHYFSTDSSGCLLHVKDSQRLGWFFFNAIKKGKGATNELLMRLSLCTQYSTAEEGCSGL